MKIINRMIKILLLLLCTGFIYISFGCATKDLFPKKLSNLHLTKLLQGKEAIKDVAKLHGKEIPVKDAWVANYQGDRSNTANIWISESFNLNEAFEQTDVMMKKIKNNPKSPFRDIEVKYISGEKVFLFSGMNQHHVVFQKEKKVIWISASSEIFKEVLDYYLKI
ncbi:MAG: hypothetical protein GY870_06935 [archaeon]|nr:hypothetical protein [archaeon]